MQEEDTGRFSGVLNALTLAAVVAAAALAVWAFWSYRKTSLMEKTRLPQVKKNLERLYELREEIHRKRAGQPPPRLEDIVDPLPRLLAFQDEYSKKGVGKIDKILTQPNRPLKNHVERSFQLEVSGVDRKTLATLLYEIENAVFFLKARDIKIEKFDVEHNHAIPKATVILSYYLPKE